MKSADDLIQALIAGQKQADACGHFCRVGIEPQEQTVKTWHNGTGASDSDCQVIHADAVLQLGTEKLGEHLGAWITAIHKRERRDLNTL